ncbi:MAG: Fe-Mn family superoxide dismutase, partial [Gammaproteobacteria bacterium]
MTAITRADRTRSARSGAAQRAARDTDDVTKLSRLVEHDIQVLKTNFARRHCGSQRNGTWDDAWASLESAWRTVRSELVQDAIPTSLAEVPLPASAPNAPTPPQVEQPSAASPTARFVDRVPGVVVILARQFASASGAHVRKGKIWLVASARAQVKIWERARPRLESAWKSSRSELDDFMCASRKFAAASAARLRRPRPQASGRKQWRILTWSQFTPSSVGQRVRIAYRSDMGERDSHRVREEARPHMPRLQSAGEISKRQLVQSKLATMAEAEPLAPRRGTLTPRVHEPSAAVPVGPFVLQPLPCLAGALAPVISSRTVQVHHGCHYATCIALANQLSREHPELAHKGALDIVLWARKHARHTELFAATSEAWNHELFWQSLTPSKKRPGGELCRAIDRAFGDFATLAQQLAVAGAAHVGSGWLWLVANRGKQLKIRTTSGTDSP